MTLEEIASREVERHFECRSDATPNVRAGYYERTLARLRADRPTGDITDLFPGHRVKRRRKKPLSPAHPAPAEALSDLELLLQESIDATVL